MNKTNIMKKNRIGNEIFIKKTISNKQMNNNKITNKKINIIINNNNNTNVNYDNQNKNHFSIYYYIINKNKIFKISIVQIISHQY